MVTRRVGTLFGAALTLGALAVGCNSLLGNTDGVLYMADAAATEGSADGTAPAEGGTSDVRGPDQDSSAPPVDASPDASPNASPDASGDADAAPVCDSGVVSGDASSPALCPGGVVYVSPNGNDAHSGCTPCAAKLSVRSALDTTTAALAALDAGVVASDAGGAVPPAAAEIHVCAGTYPEVGLQLAAPISILGGYDCSTWTRSSNYGYPTFGSSSVTTITNGDFVQQNNTLDVRSPQIGRGTVLDGLTIVGATAGSGATSAIYDHNGASPTVSNDVIVAPSVTTSTGNGGVGIYIGDNSSPDVHDNQISGGGGTTSGTTFNDVATAAVVIAVQAGLPHIHGNTINGGSGAAPNGGDAHGSVGIRVSQCYSLLTAQKGASIDSNIISGGSGGSATAGIALDPSLQNGCTVDVLGNTITGGTATASASLSAGIDARGADAVRIERNRIVGSLSTSVASSYGVLATRGTQILLVNNMIHAGPTANLAIGALLSGVQNPLNPSLAAFNTIFGGQAAAKTGTLPGVGGGTVAPAALGTVLGPLLAYSNILIGGGSTTTSAGLWMFMCQNPGNPAVTQFNANLVLNVPRGGIVGTGQQCGGVSAFPTIAGAQTFVAQGGAAQAMGNLNVAASLASCTDPNTCVPIAHCDGTTANTQACLEGLFTQWSSDGGYTTLVPPGPGWVLAGNTVCGIAAGAEPDPVNAPTDLFGNARPTSPSKPSMGADQLSGTCP
jgi:hypothetical protein